jgi:hypothetical protein
VVAFVQYFTPQTGNRLLLWGKQAAIAPFSVGEIEHDTASEGEGIKKIKTPSFEDAEHIFVWLYQRFTNRKPPRHESSLFRRATTWLEGFGQDK